MSESDATLVLDTRAAAGLLQEIFVGDATTAGIQCAPMAGCARSVTDIGLTVGFSTSASFATAFRRATGFSPSEYRRERGFGPSQEPLDEGRLGPCA